MYQGKTIQAEASTTEFFVSLSIQFNAAPNRRTGCTFWFRCFMEDDEQEVQRERQEHWTMSEQVPLSELGYNEAMEDVLKWFCEDDPTLASVKEGFEYIKDTILSSANRY